MYMYLPHGYSNSPLNISQGLPNSPLPEYFTSICVMLVILFCVLKPKALE